MEKVKIGDIVQLKSGGPKMTVFEPSAIAVTDSMIGFVGCQWFAGSKLERGYFPAESLNQVTEEPAKK